MPAPQMFLRTALTEGRIEALEKQMEWVTEILAKHLKVSPHEPVQNDEEWEAAEPKPEPKPKGKAHASR